MRGPDADRERSRAEPETRAIWVDPLPDDDADFGGLDEDIDLDEANDV